MNIPADLLNNFFDKTKERQAEILREAYDHVEFIDTQSALFESLLTSSEKDRDEYHNQYHLCETKLLSHKSIIKQLQKELESVADVLESLYGEQNGPPLIRNKDSWQKAMDDAWEKIKQHSPFQKARQSNG